MLMFKASNKQADIHRHHANNIIITNSTVDSLKKKKTGNYNRKKKHCTISIIRICQSEPQEPLYNAAYIRSKLHVH